MPSYLYHLQLLFNIHCFQVMSEEPNHTWTLQKRDKKGKFGKYKKGARGSMGDVASPIVPAFDIHEYLSEFRLLAMSSAEDLMISFRSQ